MKKPRLDEGLVSETISCFERLIESALRGGNRDRFVVISKLAGQAEKILSFQGTNVAAVDGLMGPDMLEYDNGVLMGNGPRMVLGGDQMELTRQLIDAFGPMMGLTARKNENEARRCLADELHALANAKDSLKRVGVTTIEVDDRINEIKRQLNKEPTNAVVPSEFLRGHQAGAIAALGNGQEEIQGPRAHENLLDESDEDGRVSHR